MTVKDRFQKDRRHLLLLAYWPVYLAVFVFLEQFYAVETYIPLEAGLDKVIPFCEIFIIPYLLWFPFWISLILYTYRNEIFAYKRLMWYLIICLSISLIICFLFPTCQELRPAQFPRDNFFSWIVNIVYSIDTNTNTFPSAHIIVAVGSMICIWKSRTLSKPIPAISLTLLGVLICASVVFVKQHSILDVFGALPICVLGYFICYYLPDRIGAKKKEKKTVLKESHSSSMQMQI